MAVLDSLLEVIASVANTLGVGTAVSKIRRHTYCVQNKSNEPLKEGTHPIPGRFERHKLKLCRRTRGTATVKNNQTKVTSITSNIPKPLRSRSSFLTKCTELEAANYQV